jgi:S-adenosylmethionine decarboxylase
MVSHEVPLLYAADLGACDALASLEPQAIASAFADALARAGATIVEAVAYAHADAGLTCVLILLESHAVLHTSPETGTVNIDIFSCSSSLKSLDAIDELSRSFGARHVSVQEIARADRYRPPQE